MKYSFNKYCKYFWIVIINIILVHFILPTTYAQEARSGYCVTKVGTVEGVSEDELGCKENTLNTNSPTVGSGNVGEPPPADVQQMKSKLCNDYKVCPTESGYSPPSNGWTKEQLTALWNVVQRIYAAPSYRALAIGNYILEITRATCYPLACNDGTWGYYAGQVYPQYGTKPNSRLIVITNDINNAASQLVMEWLFAHEIGHSASGGLPNGGLAGYLGGNDAYRQVESCGEIVSNYGFTNWNENNSEILAFYMTAAEEVIADYRGASKNLKKDFPCTYNAVKQAYFQGVEY